MTKKGIFLTPYIFFTSLYLFILNIDLAATYSWNGAYQLRDLEWNGANFINSEANHWHLSSCYPNRGCVKYHYCSGTGYHILGGYAVLGGTKEEFYYTTYSGLPSHNQIKMQITMYPLDSWDGSNTDDHFKFYFDGDFYYGWRLSGFAGYAYDICGNSGWLDYPPIKVTISVPHYGSTLNFRVYSYLDETSENESIGFRDIIMDFMTVSNPAYAMCGSASGSPLPDKMCTCAATNMYMSPPNSGYCYDCEPTCKTCDGGAATNCLSCYPGRYLSGTQCNVCAENCATCTGGSQANCQSCRPAYPYIVNDNRCVPDCPYPLYAAASGSNTGCYTPCPTQWVFAWNRVCSDDCSALRLRENPYNTFKVCEYPCADNQYLYWDKVCDNQCLEPATTRVMYGKYFCDHNCSASTPYLYWDKGCESYCEPRLTTKVIHGKNFCEYPCANDQYVYWDSSCGTTCYFPQIIRTFHGKQFCDFPCSSSQYLYWNNTCISTCNPPFIARYEKSVKYCDYPCSGHQYLAWNGSCLSTCNTPLIAREEGVSKTKFCDYPCQSNQIAHWTGACVDSCAYPRSSVSEGNPIKLFCVYPCTTSQYLYWNTSCINSCNAPLKTVFQESRNFCQYPCANAEFLYWNGSCKASCPAPLKTRLEASLNYCDYPCSGSQYLYWNGSCIASCASPLSPRITDGDRFCDYPCDTSLHLYWDGGCRSTCSFPLSSRQEANRNYCDYPCTGAGEYLYWNGSCITTCTLFTPRDNIGKKFCDFQCGSLDYIYWDRSCSNNCASPLTFYTEGNPMVRKFCTFPCDTSEYLYWNGTCADVCVFPLSPRNQNSRKFCSLPCDSDKYLYWNGSCKATCPGPLVIRIEGTSKYCDYPCDATEYLYWNGTCVATCNSPLVKRPVDGNNFCDYPCDPSLYLYWDMTCASTCGAPLDAVTEGDPARKFCRFGCSSNEYLYWNGSCASTCNYPLAYTNSNNRQYCHYPCNTNQYLYWNRLCDSSCPYPLTTRDEASRNYCDYPCTGSDILYWNATCIGSCNYPLYTRYENNKYFCDYPCASNQYLYWERSCLSSCEPPHETRIEGTKKFCDYPCSSGYLYWNGSCIATCLFPLASRYSQGKWYCDYPCLTSEYLYWNGSCKAGCAFPLSTRLEDSRNYCDYPCKNGKYLYWNGSCIAACQIPLEIRIDDGDKYCDYKCETTQILHWNGVCSSDCLAPRTLKVEGTPARNFCTYECALDEFLYWNGTCASTCNFPLVNKAMSSRLFCQYPCAADQFLNYDGTCLSSCPIPYLSRMEANMKYCDFPCTSSEYLFWNKSCASTCNAPLVQRTIGDFKFCDYPCTTDQFLYWDGSCEETCSLPLTQIIEGELEFRKFCNYKCVSSMNYLYWNGSCAATCPAPLVASTLKGKNHCNFPCDISQHVYWDGFCSPNCPAPLTTRVEGNAKYCDYSCPSSQYLYYNGTCSTACQVPYTSRADRGQYYCDFPCAETDYLFWNNTCLAECPTPFVPRIETTVVMRKFCAFPCGPNQYLNWAQQCQNSCVSPLVPSISSLGSYCGLPCGDSKEYYYLELGTCMKDCNAPYTVDTSKPYLQCLPAVVTTNPEEVSASGSVLFNTFLNAPIGNGTFTLVQVVKAMKYLRFLDIKLPPRLERFGSSSGKGLLSFHSNSRILDKSGASDLVGGAVPSMFSRGNADTDFISNYWGTFIFILVVLAAAIVFMLLEKISQRYYLELPTAIFKRFRVIMKWNLAIMLLATSIDDVILYASIEFRAASTVDINYFSMVLCVIFILLTAACLVGVFLIVKKHKKLRASLSKSKVDIMSFEARWQGCQVIFRGFKDNSLNPFFYLIYMIKIGFPMFITVCAPKVPLLITFVQVFTSIMIIGYLLKMKPFKKTVNQVQLVIYEGVVMMMNICMFLLTIFDATDSDAEDFSVVLGDIVIIGNDALNFIAIIFLVIRCILEARSITKYINTQQKKDRTLYIQLLCIFFQQINMGFEEMIEDEPMPISFNKVDQDIDVKSIVTEKTEVLRTESFVYPKKAERSQTMLIQEEKMFDITTKEDNWIPEISGGYKGQLSESARASKMDDHINPIKEYDGEELNTTNPRYQKLTEADEASPTMSPSMSPIAAKNENIELYSFRDPNAMIPKEETVNTVENESKDDMSGQLESLTLFRKSLVSHRKTNSQSITPINKAPEQSESINQRIAEEKEKVPSIVLPSVYQAAESETRFEGVEKTKKFLSYNWQRITTETIEDMPSPKLLLGERRQYDELRAFVADGHISEPPTETDRFELPTSKDEDRSKDNHSLEKYDVFAWKNSTERTGRSGSNPRSYSRTYSRTKSIGKARPGVE